jgi:hypothetical protein
MRIPRLRISILAAVAVVGATAAVALGAPARTHDNNTAAVQRAIAKTAAVQSGHFSFAASLAGSQAGALTFSGIGGYDSKQQETEFKLNLGSIPALLSGLGVSGLPQIVDAVSQKTVVYLHLPKLAAQTGGAGKEWLSVDLSKLPKNLTSGLSIGQLSKSASAIKGLTALSSSITVHKVGKTTVRGSSTTHYRVTADTTKVVKALVPKAQQAAALKSLKASGNTSLPIQVYVDGSGLVRRFQVTGKIKLQGSPALHLTVRVDLFDPGAKVDVTVPPASVTADATQLIAGLLGSLGGGGGG